MLCKLITKEKLLAVLFSFTASSVALSDPYSNAYGQQASMSPAGMPSSLTIGNMMIPTQSQGNFIPNGNYNSMGMGNGVYLNSGQNNPMMMPQGGMMQNQMGITSPYMAPQSSNYYNNINTGQNYNSYNAPNIGAFSVPDNTYLTNKPQYGLPAQLLQRNSANSLQPNLPYIARPNMPLNPDSMTGQGPQKINDKILDILSGGSTNNKNNGITPAVNSQNSNNNQNWMQKILIRPASNKPSRW